MLTTLPCLLVLATMTADISQLAARLGSADAAQQQEAAEQLARLGSDAQPAAVELAVATGAEDETTRDWAVAALEELGPPKESDVARLAALVGHKSLDTAFWSITLLGRLGASANAAVEPLAKVLGDKQAELPVRQKAAWALGKIGPAASPAKEALKAASAESDKRLAQLASEALQQVGG